ncbi:hypothetical protein L9F63_013080 [Diploptera punctata]|uniref:Uncharacterized protein n=1 Tax=Diploptera punctata TaxID=6984 RepID=A0AAD8AAY9_DIPPU|nr:hypothetical protein L9F63_013080 [Diploptera punctata]
MCCHSPSKNRINIIPRLINFILKLWLVSLESLSIDKITKMASSTHGQDSKQLKKKVSSVKIEKFMEAMGELETATIKMSSAFSLISNALELHQVDGKKEKEEIHKYAERVKDALEFVRVQSDTIEQKLTKF